jgi:hypothetical protein
VVTAVLLASVLDLVFAELALGALFLWPIVSEPRAVSVDANGLTIRRLIRHPRTIPWSSITEVVCRPTVTEPERARIVSGQGQVRLSQRNPGLAAVFDAIEAHAPAATRTKGTWLRR